MLKDYQKNILDLLVEQELLLARLYEIFENKLPEHRVFWSSQKGEELEHAAWVRHLEKKAEAGSIVFEEGKTRTYTIKSFLQYVEGVIAKAESGDFDMKKALSVSLDIENALIEKNKFGFFKGDSEEVKILLKMLKEHTLIHIEKVQNMLDSMP